MYDSHYLVFSVQTTFLSFTGKVVEYLNVCEGVVVQVADDKGAVETVGNGYVVTANAGKTLSASDISVKAALNGAMVDVTDGYALTIASGGTSATVTS